MTKPIQKGLRVVTSRTAPNRLICKLKNSGYAVMESHIFLIAIKENDSYLVEERAEVYALRRFIKSPSEPGKFRLAESKAEPITIPK